MFDSFTRGDALRACPWLSYSAPLALFGPNGEQHRKFSTKNNRFDLPDDVPEEIGLKEE
jgi:hypothetical protein